MSDTSFFWMRRLYSFLGLFPFGVFIIAYYIVCSSVFAGPANFDNTVLAINKLPLINLFLTIFVGIPVLIHLLMSLVLIIRGSFNFAQYSYYHNLMYVMQRLAGLIIIIFIFYHIWATVLRTVPGNHITYKYINAILSSSHVVIFYIIGVLALAFYLGNGFSDFFVACGITATSKSRKTASFVGWIITFLLGVWGLLLVLAFS